MPRTADASQPPPTAALAYNSQTLRAGRQLPDENPSRWRWPRARRAASRDRGGRSARTRAGHRFVYRRALSSRSTSTSCPEVRSGWSTTGLRSPPTGPRCMPSTRTRRRCPRHQEWAFLWCHHKPTVTASAITLSGPAKVIRGHSMTITGKLALTVGRSPSSTSRITITRSLAGASTSHPVDQEDRGERRPSTSPIPRPSSAGTHTPPRMTAPRRAQAITASRAVLVTKIPSSLRLTASADTVGYRAAVKVTAHLGPTYNSRTVRIYATAFEFDRRADQGRPGGLPWRPDGHLPAGPLHRVQRQVRRRRQSTGRLRRREGIYVRAGVKQRSAATTAASIGSTLYRLYHGATS